MFLVKVNFTSKHNCSVMLTYDNVIQDPNSLERNIQVDLSLSQKISVIHLDGTEQYEIFVTIFKNVNIQRRFI